MKKIIKKYLNSVLSLQGLEIIRKYERDYLTGKYDESVKQLIGSTREFIFPTLLVSKLQANLLKRLDGTSISEALYILYYLQQTIKLKGDVCEFGIASGATSALLASEMKTSSKNIWLFDSFQGLSKPTKEDSLINDIFAYGSMEKYAGSMSYETAEVLSRLSAIKFPKRKTKILKGFIETTVKQKNLPSKVCFAYIDFDLYQPTIVTLMFLSKKLVKNGVIVVDDYGFFSSGVKTAVDKFINDNKDTFTLTLPYSFAGHFCIITKTS